MWKTHLNTYDSFRTKRVQILLINLPRDTWFGLFGCIPPTPQSTCPKASIHQDLALKEGSIWFEEMQLKKCKRKELLMVDLWSPTPIFPNFLQMHFFLLSIIKFLKYIQWNDTHCYHIFRGCSEHFPETMFCQPDAGLCHFICLSVASFHWLSIS